jgi:cyclic lactone autoinducer peptide
MVFPKGTNLNTITQQQANEACNILNHQPDEPATAKPPTTDTLNPATTVRTHPRSCLRAKGPQCL